MGDRTTATEGVFLTGESEVGLAVVFRAVFEFTSFDADSDLDSYPSVYLYHTWGVFLSPIVFSMFGLIVYVVPTVSCDPC